MARKQHDPPVPPGLKTRGARTWVTMTSEYSFNDAPERLLILEELCRCIDTVDRLQAIIDAESDLRVKGSQGQPVALPEIAEARQWRQSVIALTRALALPADDEQDLSPTALGKLGAQARWGNRSRGA